MNYDYACSILEFTDCDDINEGTIKKRYRMLALVYHPDKNISDGASEKFIKIKEAYDYLLKYEGYMKSETESENNFKGSLYIDDNIEISTWIIDTDQKIKLSRYFQIINISNNQTVFTSRVDYACISLNNFKPVRMPELFRKKYVITTNV